MKKLFIILMCLLPVFVNAQYSLYRIYISNSTSDTLYLKNNTDSLFRLIAGEYVFGNKSRTLVYVPSTNVTGNVLQPTLVSGTNIKTVNGSTLLGSGDIAIGGLDPTKLAILNNLSDLNNAATARTNLGLVIGTDVLAPNGNGSSLTGLTKTQVGLSNVDNTSDANKPVSTATQTALNLKQNTITVLPFANGGISGSAATSATTGTMTVNMTSSIITITPTGACTFNASGGVAGQIITFSITTSGVSSFVLTFGTNFRKTGTLATGTTSARFFTVTFRCLDGTIWTEIGRTGAQT